MSGTGFRGAEKGDRLLYPELEIIHFLEWS